MDHDRYVMIESKWDTIMMVSTRGCYVLRVMIDLAEQSNGKYMAMKSVAERQEINGSLSTRPCCELNVVGKSPLQARLFTHLNGCLSGLPPLS